MPFANPSTKITSQMKRLGAGGLGRGGGESNLDSELEDLIVSDEERYEDAQPLGASQYHPVGGIDEPGMVVTPGCEGYFELCVKSVEAVLWDPEAEEAEDDVDIER